MDNSPLPMCVASVSLGLPPGNLRRPRASAPDGVQSVSGHGRGVARPMAVWRTICHRRRCLTDDDLVDLAGATWQERLGRSDLAGAIWQERHARIAACSGLSRCHPGRGRGQRKAGTRFRRKNPLLYKCGASQPPNSASSRAATASATSSRHDLAMTCTPSGRPSLDVPQRTTAAGHPVML